MNVGKQNIKSVHEKHKNIFLLKSKLNNLVDVNIIFKPYLNSPEYKQGMQFIDWLLKKDFIKKGDFIYNELSDLNKLLTGKLKDVKNLA